MYITFMWSSLRLNLIIVTRLGMVLVYSRDLLVTTTYSTLILDTIIPKITSRKLLSYSYSTTMNDHLSYSQCASTSMVQW